MDRVSRITNERIQAWLRSRTVEAKEAGDAIFAEVAEALRQEAEDAFDHDLNPWDSDWIELRRRSGYRP